MFTAEQETDAESRCSKKAPSVAQSGSFAERAVQDKQSPPF